VDPVDRRGFAGAPAPQSGANHPPIPCRSQPIRRPVSTRRPPLSGNKTPQQTTRKDRRAAERTDRFAVERDSRKQRTGSPRSGGGSSLINTRNVTLVAVVVGVLIVAFIGFGQLGNQVTGTFKDPGIKYDASIVHDNELGSASAPVTLEVYGDFQCPICAKESLDVEPAIVTKYVVPGKLRIIHHDIAILGRPKPTDPANESRIAASGAVCAMAQGKYWDYAHWLFNNQVAENGGEFTTDRVTAIAKAAGIDTTSFSTCLAAATTTGLVDEITAKAGAMGINNTPTMYLNGAPAGAPGYKTADQLSALIDAALAGPSSSPAASAAASAAPATSASASASTNP
jgi:protein-disulfide isomerase